MASKVKSRPNHYEVLGLTPGASDEDIARAFAREMSPFRPHAVRDLAQLSLAFETLRDPARRRAYDESLAPKPEPAPSQSSVPRRDGWPFVASARIGSAEMPAIGALPTPPRQPEPVRAEPPPDPVKDDARDGRIATPRLPEALTRPRPAPPRDADRARPSAMEERFLQAEDGAIEWKRPALIVGGLFLGVALLGGWLGWESGNDIDAALPEQALTLTVPQAKAPPAAATSTPAPPPRAAEARPERRERAAAAPAVRTPLPPARAEEQEVAEALPSGQDRIEDTEAGLAAADPAPVAATPAELPLPDAVIARTIGRIGYACGRVASTSAVEGGTPGVFKVTCTSGDSYRAAPVRGRYHFRRWGRR